MYFDNHVTLPVMGYTYDALYRLIEATGREQIGTATFGTADNHNDAAWMGIAHKGDDNATQNYTQKYSYDAVGNILELQHGATTGSYTRNYTYHSYNSRLQSTMAGANTYTYSHDVYGNITAMPHLSAIGYNSLQHMSAANLGGGGNAYYQYDAGGQRVHKVIVNGSLKEERIYLGSYEIYRKYTGATLDLERITLHIADDTGRIAMYEKRTSGTDGSAATLQRYIYSNHLSTASLELDYAAAIISYEEYHPYGTTAYQAMNASINAVAKRYRYTGKERDEETGLYYHGARYYVPWLCRWMACDPLEAKYAGMSAYNYGFNNPIKWQDSTGMEPDWGGHDTPATSPKTEDATTKTDNIGDVLGKALGSTIIFPGIPVSIDPEILQGAAERGLETVKDIVGGLWDRFNQNNKFGTVDPTVLFKPSELENFALHPERIGEVIQTLVNEYSDLIEKAVKGDKKAIGALGFEAAALLIPEGTFSKAFQGLSKESKLLVSSAKLSEGGRELIFKTYSGTKADAIRLSKEMAGMTDKDVVPLLGKPTRQYPNADETVIGFQTKDETSAWRLDFDAEKGAHINWEKDKGRTSGAVKFDGTKEQVDVFKQQLTKAFFNPKYQKR